MWSLLAVKYGLYTGDTELLEFGLQQPVLFASKLQDPDSGLFYHAWNIPGDCLLPANNTFWLRGNGWVLASVGEMLRLIGPGHASYDQMAAIFVSLAEGSLEWRQPSGYWDTVMTDPGYAYEESSGSALIAFGYARGVNLGLLDDSYMDLAKDTFKAITARMKKRSVGYTMEEISIGTNPSGKWLYSMVPKDRNLSYGVGAFLLLAAELAEESIE
jgi:unsaturated rhamnogalacturonyl hydrolase